MRWKLQGCSEWSINATAPLMLIYYFDYHMRFYFEEQLLSPEAAELPPLQKGLRRLLMCNKVEDMMPAWKTNIQVSRLLLGKGDHEKGGPGLPLPTATTTAEKKLPVKNFQIDARYTGTDAIGTMLKGRITALLAKAHEMNLLVVSSERVVLHQLWPGQQSRSAHWSRKKCIIHVRRKYLLGLQ